MNRSVLQRLATKLGWKKESRGPWVKKDAMQELALLAA